MTGASAPAAPAGALGVLCRLLGPADASAATVDAGRDWTAALPPVGPADAVVWGGDVLAARGAGALARHAVRREVALARARRSAPSGGHRLVLRTAPPLTRSGGTARLRRWLAGGVVVRVAGPQAAGPTLLQALAAHAGLDIPVPADGLTVGSGGAVLARATAAGSPVMLRVAGPGTPGDPRGLAAPLRALEDAGVGLVPRALGSGLDAGLAWTVETRLRGSTAQNLTPALLDDVAAFCAALPAGGTVDVPRPSAVATGLLAEHAAGLAEVEDVLAAALAGRPGVLAHGDLWTGNLLVEDGRLTGVVDWDGSHAGGVPGTDLLHAVATDDRLRAHRSLGAELLATPWRTGPAAEGLRRGWARAGLDLSPAAADAVGLAWWARQVATAVTRNPALADDAHWVDQNVAAVLGAWRSVLAPA